MEPQNRNSAKCWPNAPDFANIISTLNSEHAYPAVICNGANPQLTHMLFLNLEPHLFLSWNSNNGKITEFSIIRDEYVLRTLFKLGGAHLRNYIILRLWIFVGDTSSRNLHFIVSSCK